MKRMLEVHVLYQVFYSCTCVRVRKSQAVDDLYLQPDPHGVENCSPGASVSPLSHLYCSKPVIALGRRAGRTALHRPSVDQTRSWDVPFSYDIVSRRFRPEEGILFDHLKHLSAPNDLGAMPVRPCV